MSMSALKTAGMSVGVLAIVVLMVLAVITGFKDTNLVDNTTADNFTTGMAIFGTFASIIVLALLGKAVIGIVSKGKTGE